MKSLNKHQTFAKNEDSLFFCSSFSRRFCSSGGRGRTVWTRLTRNNKLEVIAPRAIIQLLDQFADTLQMSRHVVVNFAIILQIGNVILQHRELLPGVLQDRKDNSDDVLPRLNPSRRFVDLLLVAHLRLIVLPISFTIASLFVLLCLFFAELNDLH